VIRNLSIALIALFAAFTLSSQTPVTQLRTEQLTQKQVNALLTTASTPADHERLANYYELKAQEYRAQAQVHAQMLVGFMANSATNNSKAQFGTVNHCDFMFKSLNQRARAAHKLALEQERLAQTAVGAE
jgi:hypothetical protein